MEEETKEIDKTRYIGRLNEIKFVNTIFTDDVQILKLARQSGETYNEQNNINDWMYNFQLFFNVNQFAKL